MTRSINKIKCLFCECHNASDRQQKTKTKKLVLIKRKRNYQVELNNNNKERTVAGWTIVASFDRFVVALLQVHNHHLAACLSSAVAAASTTFDSPQDDIDIFLRKTVARLAYDLCYL